LPDCQQFTHYFEFGGRLLFVAFLPALPLFETEQAAECYNQPHDNCTAIFA